MHYEYFTNAPEGGMAWAYEGFRCLDCGEVVDPLILENRLFQRRTIRKPDGEPEPVGAGQGRDG
jgi:hypothetical protein